jgi:hypothetical protein
MDHDEIQSTVAGISKRETSRVSVAPLVCAVCFCVVYLCPILPDNPTAHNCLAILVGAWSRNNCGTTKQKKTDVARQATISSVTKGNSVAKKRKPDIMRIWLGD